jgi:hypothetical protein
MAGRPLVLNESLCDIERNWIISKSATVDSPKHNTGEVNERTVHVHNHASTSHRGAESVAIHVHGTNVRRIGHIHTGPRTSNVVVIGPVIPLCAVHIHVIHRGSHRHVHVHVHIYGLIALYVQHKAHGENTKQTLPSDMEHGTTPCAYRSFSTRHILDAMQDW